MGHGDVALDGWSRPPGWSGSSTTRCSYVRSSPTAAARADHRLGATVALRGVGQATGASIAVVGIDGAAMVDMCKEFLPSHQNVREPC